MENTVTPSLTPLAPDIAAMLNVTHVKGVPQKAPFLCQWCHDTGKIVIPNGGSYGQNITEECEDCEWLKSQRRSKAVRMDISALPADAQHHRNGLLPTVQPLVSGGKVLWVPTVINQRDTTTRGSILWSDRERASDDRDEAFALACYSCDRFVVAEYLQSQGKTSLPLTG